MYTIAIIYDRQGSIAFYKLFNYNQSDKVIAITKKQLDNIPDTTNELAFNLSYNKFLTLIFFKDFVDFIYDSGFDGPLGNFIITAKRKIDEYNKAWDKIENYKIGLSYKDNKAFFYKLHNHYHPSKNIIIIPYSELCSRAIDIESCPELTTIMTEFQLPVLLERGLQQYLDNSSFTGDAYSFFTTAIDELSTLQLINVNWGSVFPINE